MNTIGLNMFPVTSTATVKPEIDNSDIQLSIPLAMQQEKFPKWITDFNMKCLEICGTTCSEKLDEMMELYIKEVKREMVYYGPGNASVVVNRMSRTMLFFYLKYVDIKEFIVISQWNEHMEDLLSLYCQLELRSAQRGKDSDIIICSRIMYALWTYLNSDEEHMLHVLLKIPNISKRHKKILDPLFRKLLVDKKKPDCDLEYIRKLFAYKLWKRLYNVDEKKAISELAYNELQPPKSFIANYTKYHFLPRNLGSSDVHRALITAMFDIENAIHAYFEYVDNKNKRLFDNDYILPEKKSFMTEFWNSFSTNDNFDEISTTSDTFTLERIKQEVDNIDTDDDCIIIEPIKSPSSSGNQTRPVIIDATEVIDLTADENEPSSVEIQTDEVPQWCSNLIKISEECVPATPPYSITEEDTQQTIQCLEKEEMGKREIIEQIPAHTITQIENELINEEIESKKIEPPPLDVKISNVRRARLDSDSTDLSLPDTLSSSTSEDNSHGFREITSTSHPVQELPTKSICPSPSEHAVSVNYEQVDSTSNLNENENEEIETIETIEAEAEPVVQTFLLDRSITGLMSNDTLTQVTVSVPPESVRVPSPIPTPEPAPAPAPVPISLPVPMSVAVPMPMPMPMPMSMQMPVAVPIPVPVPVPVPGPGLGLGSMPVQVNTATVSSNMDFEQYTYEQQASRSTRVESFTATCSNGSVSNLNIVSVKHVSEESALGRNDAFNISYVTSVIERDEPIEPETRTDEDEDVDVDVDVDDDIDVDDFDGELDVCSEDNVQSKVSEDDIQSPAFEPITQNDCINYVKGLGTSQYYENFYKESISSTANLENNRKRKNGDIPQVVRATTKRPSISKPQTPPPPLPVPVEIPPQPEVTHRPQTSEQKERRVPLSGEKVCRFADTADVWESVFTDKFKMSKLEYELFNPRVVLKKLNPQHFIPNVYTSNHEEPTPYYSQTIDHSHRNNLHMSRFKTKGILEYQQYTKGSSVGDKPRARIVQINRSESNSSPMHRKEPSSTVTSVKKKKGTGSPDLNINLTLPKLESLSLNSSFQHHFCTDISVCTSGTKCYSDPSLSATDPSPSQITPRSRSPRSFEPPDAHRQPQSQSQPQPIEQSYKPPNMESESQMQVPLDFKRPICDTSTSFPSKEERFDFKRPKIDIPAVASTSTSPSTSVSAATSSQIIESKQEVIPAPILPAEVPYWHEIDSSEPPQKFDHSQAPNLLVNVNLDQSEQEIHLPIKKRRVSSFKVEVKDELSYPATPMISIAELENIERNKARNHRPFKTPAELKEVPPIHPSYMYNTMPPMTTVSDMYNISHTYSTPPPTPSYQIPQIPSITPEPIIPPTPHYPLPPMQPLMLPVSRSPKTNWEQPTSSSYNNYRKRRQAASRKETATNRTVQKEKSKSHKTKIS